MRRKEGVVKMMPDATQQHRDALTEERLFSWHAALFYSGKSCIHGIMACAWRDIDKRSSGRKKRRLFAKGSK